MPTQMNANALIKENGAKPPAPSRPGIDRPLRSLSVSKVEREPSRLGAYILNRMSELGMARQVDLVRATGGNISESAVSRIITQPNYFPDHKTLEYLADGLRIDRRSLILFAYGLEDGAPRRENTGGIHPLAMRLDRVLQSDGGASDDDRRTVEIIVDRVITPIEDDMRRRKTA